MQSQRIPMTVEQYLTLPRKFGWKYEYIDGNAEIRPREMVICASVPIQARDVPSVLPLRVVAPSDEAELKEVFVACFHDSVEYCDWPAESFQRAVRKNIEGFFAGVRGEPLSVSVVAVQPAAPAGPERIVGAALVVRDAVGPFLDLLFVRPEWQRQGVAAAMVATVVNALLAQGETALGSSYHPANEASVAWHQWFGFVEEPDWMLAQSRYHHARYELQRREAQGDLGPEERQVLERDCREWEARWRELKARLDREGIETVSPPHRRHAGPAK